MSIVPCPTCPWRRTSTIGGADIPGFNLDKMRRLACTIGNGDDFRRIMACHYSPEGAETACIGYLARHGYSNLSVRVLAAREHYDMPAIAEACAGLDLWPDFDTMLVAYEAAAQTPQEAHLMSAHDDYRERCQLAQQALDAAEDGELERWERAAMLDHAKVHATLALAAATIAAVEVGLGGTRP